MTINITSGSSGWGNYVLYGTKDKPRDSEKVQFLEGDIALGDRLSQSNNYEESYYKIVLAFEGKPSDEVLKSAYEDFKKEMFVGFKPDEYHIDAVIHKDTDNYHIHCRVPKQNLKTDTHLQLYMDKIDRPRKELIQDHISLKYGFNIAREQNREVFKEQAHEHINKWREQHNQKPFDFKTKQGQKEAEAQINAYLSELIKSGLIEKREDISTTLQELGLKIEKENGLDIKKDFAYTTVSNESGKLRIKGEIHHDRFYEHSQKDRSSQIDNNRRIEPDRGSIEERAKQVQKELRRANEKRYNKVTELFKTSRARAEREHKQTLENGRLESLNSSKSIKSNSRNNSNYDILPTKTKQLSKDRREDNTNERRRKVSNVSSKRAYIRPTKESILLQNQIKDNRNERLIRATIERIREQREASATALQRARTERELVQSRITGNHEELQSRTSKIATYYGKIREKIVNTINEVKEKIKDFDFDNLVNRVKSSRDKAETPDKSVSSSLDKIKEVQKPLKNNDLKSYFAEKLSANFAEIDKKAVETQAQEVTKKRSYGRSR